MSIRYCIARCLYGLKIQLDGKLFFVSCIADTRAENRTNTHCHPQTDYFVVSQLFSVARQARFQKQGSKRSWLKRQSEILPLIHEDSNASEVNLNTFVTHLICLHISASRLPRAQFIWRALLYANGDYYIPHKRAQPYRGRRAYILSSTDRLFRWITTLQCGKTG